MPSRFGGACGREGREYVPVASPLRRPRYGAACVWIAKHDPSQVDIERGMLSVGEWPTVQLVAHLFGQSVEAVAANVIRLRRSPLNGDRNDNGV